MRRALGLAASMLLTLPVAAPVADTEQRSAASTCAKACLEEGRGCRACVRTMAEEHYVTPRQLPLRYAKAHSSIPDPEVAIAHHHFLDRPPHTLDSLDCSAGVVGKTHANCPAMRARSRVRAITIRMPYTARFFRSGDIEVDCDWIAESNGSSRVHRIEVPVSDSPWFRLPQSHLHIFTIGDTRSGVWIINSGIYASTEVIRRCNSAIPGIFLSAQLLVSIGRR